MATPTKRIYLRSHRLFFPLKLESTGDIAEVIQNDGEDLYLKAVLYEIPDGTTLTLQWEPIPNGPKVLLRTESASGGPLNGFAEAAGEGTPLPGGGLLYINTTGGTGTKKIALVFATRREAT